MTDEDRIKDGAADPHVKRGLTCAGRAVLGFPVRFRIGAGAGDPMPGILNDHFADCRYPMTSSGFWRL